MNIGFFYIPTKNFIQIIPTKEFGYENFNHRARRGTGRISY